MNVTGLNWLSVNNGSGNGLVPSGNITWANVDQDLCHHMVSLGHNELKLICNTDEMEMSKHNRRCLFIRSFMPPFARRGYKDPHISCQNADRTDFTLRWISSSKTHRGWLALVTSFAPLNLRHYWTSNSTNSSLNWSTDWDQIMHSLWYSLCPDNIRPCYAHESFTGLREAEKYPAVSHQRVMKIFIRVFARHVFLLVNLSWVHALQWPRVVCAVLQICQKIIGSNWFQIRQKLYLLTSPGLKDIGHAPQNFANW